MSSIPTVTPADRLREQTALLESIAADRRVLDELPDEDRDRLLRAIAHVYSPDRYARRRQSKDEHRARKASRAEVHDRIKASAAIRTLHRKAPVTTPNVFPPEGFTPMPRPAPAPSRGNRSSRSTAMSARRGSRSSITSTTSCARRVRRSTSPSAPSWPTCAVGSRC
jgi:hypothetical protein